MFRKYLLLSIFLFVIICRPGWCGQGEWAKRYGKDYANAPLTICEQFSLATGFSWQDATAEERFKFLNQLEADQKRLENEKKLAKQKKEKEKAAVEKIQQERQRAVKQAQEKKRAEEAARAAERQARMQKLQALKTKRQAQMRSIKQKSRSRKSK